MALDKRVEKAREPRECVNCGHIVQKGSPYWLLPKPGTGPAVTYCGPCYTTLPSYFKRTAQVL